MARLTCTCAAPPCICLCACGHHEMEHGVPVGIAIGDAPKPCLSCMCEGFDPAVARVGRKAVREALTPDTVIRRGLRKLRQ